MTGFYLNNFLNKIWIKKNYAKQKSKVNLDIDVIMGAQEKEISSLASIEPSLEYTAENIQLFINNVKELIGRLIKHFHKK